MLPPFWRSSVLSWAFTAPLSRSFIILEFSFPTLSLNSITSLLSKSCPSRTGFPPFHSPGLWAIVITFRLSSVVRPSTFHILIFSSETTGPIATKLWWNGPWMAPFQNCVRWSRLPTKMAAKLKIEKRGDEILIVHCCFSVSQNELKF
jgi:hypothetical protein